MTVGELYTKNNEEYIVLYSSKAVTILKSIHRDFIICTSDVHEFSPYPNALKDLLKKEENLKTFSIKSWENFIQDMAYEAQELFEEYLYDENLSPSDEQALKFLNQTIRELVDDSEWTEEIGITSSLEYSYSLYDVSAGQILDLVPSNRHHDWKSVRKGMFYATIVSDIKKEMRKIKVHDD